MAFLKDLVSLDMWRLVVFAIITLIACKKETLHVVTIGEFKEFVKETGYVTDAEKYNWSFVQKNVYDFEVVENINWKNNENASTDDFPVTQVSFNDAKAYAEWSNTKIPDYETYWKLARNDQGIMNTSSTEILPVDQCHIIGNVWEITTPDRLGQIRLAGGSYLCSPNSCNGTEPERELFVDTSTANSHIGIAVIMN